LDQADEAVIFYNLETLKIKQLTPIKFESIKNGFKRSSIEVFNQKDDLQNFLINKNYNNTVLVMMSSGDFGDLSWETLKARISEF
jgi:UDP-N-acetylmuramate: L-alanyl-gamma-D-glutamyl-meso-diaminopimelate ligase